jgi:hypothetical protein
MSRIDTGLPVRNGLLRGIEIKLRGVYYLTLE